MPLKATVSQNGQSLIAPEVLKSDMLVYKQLNGQVMKIKIMDPLFLLMQAKKDSLSKHIEIFLKNCSDFSPKSLKKMMVRLTLKTFLLVQKTPLEVI